MLLLVAFDQFKLVEEEKIAISGKKMFFFFSILQDELRAFERN